MGKFVGNFVFSQYEDLQKKTFWLCVGDAAVQLQCIANSAMWPTAEISCYFKFSVPLS